MIRSETKCYASSMRSTASKGTCISGESLTENEAKKSKNIMVEKERMERQNLVVRGLTTRENKKES